MATALRARHLQTRAAVAVAAAMALVATLVVVPHSPVSSDDTFSNGTAFATAAVSRVAPGVGDLSLAITGGIATAEVRNQLAQAQAQSVDLGLIGSSLTAQPCDGSESRITPDDLPQPTRVDNRKGDATAQSDEVPVAGSNLSLGREQARATRQPLASALSTTLSGDFGGVIKLGGGRAEATTRIVDGKAREALATSEGALEIAGIVTLSGLKWSALHRTGASPAATGSFAIGSASAFGAPIPSGQTAPVEAAVNTALAFTGIRVEMPRIERLTSPSDLVRVTPLRIVLEDSPLGSLVLGPVLGASRPQREQLFIEIVKQYCRASSLLLVGDISLSVLSGTGFLAFEIGGAEATTATAEFENPFGSDGGLLPPLGGGGFPGLPGIAAAPSFTAAGPVPPVAPARRGATEIITSSGPLKDRCESFHLAGTSCSEGSAVVFGLLALAAVAGVAGLDWQRQRRRRAGAGV